MLLILLVTTNRVTEETTHRRANPGLVLLSRGCPCPTRVPSTPPPPRFHHLTNRLLKLRQRRHRPGPQCHPQSARRRPIGVVVTRRNSPRIPISRTRLLTRRPKHQHHAHRLRRRRTDPCGCSRDRITHRPLSQLPPSGARTRREIRQFLSRPCRHAARRMREDGPEGHLCESPPRRDQRLHGRR